jgi:hypothetical protein
MAQAAHELDASMERVRRARERLTEASYQLAQTRQQVEHDPHVERVRHARGRLDAANQHLAKSRELVEADQHPNAVDLATDD